MSWFRRRRCGDVTTRAKEAKKLVEEVHADDEPLRVQAAMLEEKHEPVADLDKQNTAPLFELGPSRKVP